MSNNPNNGRRASGQATSPLEWFVDSLLQSAGQIQLIVHHMLRYDADTESQSETTIDETLRWLIRDALKHALEREPRDYAAAAVLLADVRKAIEDEIYLVDPASSDWALAYCAVPVPISFTQSPFGGTLTVSLTPERGALPTSLNSPLEFVRVFTSRESLA